MAARRTSTALFRCAQALDPLQTLSQPQLPVRIPVLSPSSQVSKGLTDLRAPDPAQEGVDLCLRDAGLSDHLLQRNREVVGILSPQESGLAIMSGQKARTVWE
jgi:hypothetical protein